MSENPLVAAAVYTALMAATILVPMLCLGGIR